MLLFRCLVLLLCAEWLLLFRVWMSLKYLILFLVFTLIRARFLNVIPHWDNHVFLYLATFPALLYHFQRLGRAARYREAYGTPETGVPWLATIGRTDKAACALELVIVLAFIMYMDAYGVMVYPHGFDTLDPDWQHWFSQPGHAEAFALFYASAGMIALGIWRQLDAGILLWKSKTTPRTQFVREIRRRSSPKLANVKELSEELQQFYE
jgi:hypothetical protein